MRRTFLAALSLTALAASPALAGPAGDAATKRFNEIASGDVAAVTGAYADKATLHWVGGMLDGTYTDAAQIKELWTKFTKGQGPLKVSITNMAESMNPKGATVTANVVFTGQAPIKVRYVLVYREGKLIDEIWQVDPNLPS